MSRLDRYQNPDLYERLAAEYVLGTLRGLARARFETLMEARPYLRAAVEGWEARFDPLVDVLPERQPPARVWRRVQREIEALNRQAGARERRRWQTLSFWRGATALASVLVVAGVLWLGLGQPADSPVSLPSYVAVLENDEAQAMVVATAIANPMSIHIKLMGDPPMGPDQDLQLWCIPKGGGDPMPMGILAGGRETVMPVNQHDWDALEEVQYLAISAEPKGGSPTGKPTGKVMYVGSLMSLG